MMANKTSVLDPPARPTGATIRRKAMLFRAGAYDNKGVTVTPADLIRLAEAFTPVPLLVEHAESPLDLGELAGVEAVGDTLFGTVALSESADRLLRESGATGLSIGLAADLSAIRELSLVKRPRVDGARLFSRPDRVTFEADLELPPREIRISPADEVLLGTRCVPAARPFARALLAAAQEVTFGAQTVATGALVRSMLTAMPRHRFTSDPLVTSTPTRSDEDADAALFTPEEASFYRKHFPGG